MAHTSNRTGSRNTHRAASASGAREGRKALLQGVACADIAAKLRTTTRVHGFRRLYCAGKNHKWSRCLLLSIGAVQVTGVAQAVLLRGTLV